MTKKEIARVGKLLPKEWGFDEVKVMFGTLIMRIAPKDLSEDSRYELTLILEEVRDA